MPYTVKTLAKRWSCSDKHVYNLIAGGQLKSFAIGLKRGTRISDAEVQRWEEKEKSHIGMGTLASENQTDGGLPASSMRALTSANVRG